MKSYKTISMLTVVGALMLSEGALATATSVNPLPSNPINSLNADQIEQVKKVIHDYLVTNPQVLVEASQVLQRQEMAKVEQKAQSAVLTNASAIFADVNSPVVGNPKGDVTVVEFFDYQCPHCKEMVAVMDKAQSSDPNLRIIYKELPIFGPGSRDASAAALAAQMQGPDKYLKLHNALLSAPNPLNKDKVMAIAKTVGLNVDQLAKDMNSDVVKKQIDDNMKLAQSLSLMGTPTFIVSQWQAGMSGATSRGVEKAAFVPGIISLSDLQTLVNKARKS